MAHPKVENTNAARLLDRAKIAYELVPYRVDEEHLAATHVAEQLGEDIATVFKTLVLKGDRTGYFVCVVPGDHEVDLKAAAEYGIPVVRVPAYSPHAVAEYAVMLMLTLNRKVHRAYWRTRDGNFSLHGLLGFDMYGKTAGIVGTGKIARELIRILKGFGMEVLAYDIYRDPEYAVRGQIEYVSLD